MNTCLAGLLVAAWVCLGGKPGTDCSLGMGCASMALDILNCFVEVYQSRVLQQGSELNKHTHNLLWQKTCSSKALLCAVEGNLYLIMSCDLMGLLVATIGVQHKVVNAITALPGG